MREHPESLASAADELVIPDAARRRRIARAALFGGAEPAALIGRFELVRHLGSGATGLVYLAKDPVLDREVAIKVLHRELSDGDAGQWLLGEAKALARLSHANIVIVHEVGMHEGQLFLAMEYVRGTLLERWLQQEVRSEREILGAFVQAGRALSAAHRQGYVHRDFKAANAIIDERGTVKVLDFGFARAISIADDVFLARLPEVLWEGSMTATGRLMGTPAYMAPEQLLGHADARSDQFSFAASLFQALYGVLPFLGATPSALLRAMTNGAPHPVRLAPGRTTKVHRALLRALRPTPSERWPSLEALLAELEPAVAARPGRRRRFVGLSVGAAFAIAVLILLMGHENSREANIQATPPASSWSPLNVPDSILACPLLKASGVDDPAGWLGATAAAMACERARIVLGGRYERTLVPAELLDLPAGVVDDFPSDPYCEAGARERSIEAARARATAYLDGTVEARPPGFRVMLEIIAQDGPDSLWRSFGRGSGEGASLNIALRAAFGGLEATGAVPRASALNHDIAEWSRAHTIDAGLASLDMYFAFEQRTSVHADECARAKAFGADLGAAGTFFARSCEPELGQETSLSSEPAVDDASPGALAWSAYAVIDAPSTDPEYIRTLSLLGDRREDEPSALGRAILLATESCLLAGRDPSRSTDLATLSIETFPRFIEVPFCPRWALPGREARGEAAPRWRAWRPWSIGPHLVAGEGALELARRAHTLAPYDAAATGALVEQALAGGRHAEARAAIAEIAAGGAPERDTAMRLRAQLAASEAAFALALDLAESGLAAQASGPFVRGGCSTEPRYLTLGLQIARIVGRSQSWADAVFRSIIEPGTAKGTPILRREHLQLAAICLECSPSVRARCFARLRGIQQNGIVADDPPGAHDFIEGARRYGDGDLIAAASLWAPLVRSEHAVARDGAFTDILPDQMSIAFERAGWLELAEAVDRATMTKAYAYNGATLAHLREASRARARGDDERARALAREVIRAWSVADVPVPALVEARSLLALTERRSRDR